MPDSAVYPYEEEGLTHSDRAHRLCDVLQLEMRKLGVITTAHYEQGISHIVRMIEAVLREGTEKDATE